MYEFGVKYNFLNKESIVVYSKGYCHLIWKEVAKEYNLQHDDFLDDTTIWFVNKQNEWFAKKRELLFFLALN